MQSNELGETASQVKEGMGQIGGDSGRESDNKDKYGLWYIYDNKYLKLVNNLLIMFESGVKYS